MDLISKQGRNGSILIISILLCFHYIGNINYPFFTCQSTFIHQTELKTPGDSFYSTSSKDLSHTLGQHPEILLQHQQLPILRGGLQHICSLFIALWVDKLLLLLSPEKIIHVYHAAFERKCRTAVPVLFFHLSLGLFDHLRKLRLFAALREGNIDISEYNLTLT